ncbi:MAG: long-chain fatty acid--CoA ligase [Alphaproteobacteria bacterium]|nr:long-chain fatty acid--CoA ligase [Alphaproteobacteria bacterium]MBU0797930.1 long-chain fatty acid--CoA ligase [Alphaproteobacteria bacterium]MBU0886118.1 long-chain fatty acid--CoA ligase [Alphaproteobacteria bacterium]MBU1812758.1 long-chain fatty acid--CoA ligase [Alphaproteobacteria bacterium]MBU2091124.1 long-chain fatty acid--CoA ligase [Alphaproteobacteria bacterium]
MLRAALRTRPLDSPALFYKGQTIPAAALTDTAYGGRVALRLDDPLALARAIIALDGTAERVLLLPDLPQETIATLMAQAGIDQLIRDSSELTAGHSDRPTEWILATSGTTGVPKLVRHIIASLTRMISASGWQEGQRWGLLYDMTRFAGLQVLLQALLGGASLILTRGDDPLPRRVAELAEAGCTALSATPTLWRKLMMTPGAETLPLQQITLGGEIVDADSLSALHRRYPVARLTHIYASTEAGAAFSVTDGQAGFPARYLDNPPKGIALAIREDRLFVRNPLVDPAYLGGEKHFADAEGFVDTGDSVIVTGDRVFFAGREDGCINVGGNKVHPEEVEAVLLSHPDVALARVSARRNPITGQLVVADIVPAGTPGDPAALRRSIEVHCAAMLAPFKRPALIRLVADLDIGASGKLSRTLPGSAS